MPGRPFLRLSVCARCLRLRKFQRARFSSSRVLREIRSLGELPGRVQPRYQETPQNDLLSLHWPEPPRNVLLVQKENAVKATGALIEFAKYIGSTYPPTSLILESTSAQRLHEVLPFPIYSDTSPTLLPSQGPLGSPYSSLLAEKTDIVATFGGDGTILRASSLFSHSATVPPILSFSLGTLGFLSEFQFAEHAQAWSDVYNSGTQSSTKPARILLRNRLRVGLSPPSASPSRPSQSPPPTTKSSSPDPPAHHALNEILLHRGASPHLAHLTITLNGRPLTTAIADGLLISSPTGSTAYSLSAGGSIVHPLVKGIVVTPICARSLSFRPLVLPGEAVIGVQVGEGTRPFSVAGDVSNVSSAGKVDVSIDGVQIPGGLGVGGEVKVWGEAVGRRDEVERDWVGGVPCVMRGGEKGGDEGWVGGLNGLLKFNYPFGEEGG